MIPIRDNNHTAEALALLTDMFKKQPVIAGILESLGTEIQQIEDATWGLINGILLATCVGDVLDKYGAIVLLPRGGLGDTDYRTALLLRIKLLRAQGLAEDIIQAAVLVLASFIYEEWQPAAWTVLSLNAAAPVTVLRMLGQAKAAATRGVFLFSTWAPGNDIIWGSTIGTVSTAKGFMDKVSGQFPYTMISSQDFLR